MLSIENAIRQIKDLDVPEDNKVCDEKLSQYRSRLMVLLIKAFKIIDDSFIKQGITDLKKINDRIDSSGLMGAYDEVCAELVEVGFERVVFAACVAAYNNKTTFANILLGDLEGCVEVMRLIRESFDWSKDAGVSNGEIRQESMEIMNAHRDDFSKQLVESSELFKSFARLSNVVSEAESMNDDDPVKSVMVEVAKNTLSKIITTLLLSFEKNFTTMARTKLYKEILAEYNRCEANNNRG